jgi:hypothetical protein
VGQRGDEASFAVFDPSLRRRVSEALLLTPDALTVIWVRDRRSGGSAEVVHCHLLFHLAHPFLAGQKRIQVETALERLIDRHGRGNHADYTLKLTFPRNPNGLYLLKGGAPDVWSAFGVPFSWRKRQGSLSVSAVARQKILAPLPDIGVNRVNQIKKAVA